MHPSLLPRVFSSFQLWLYFVGFCALAGMGNAWATPNIPRGSGLPPPPPQQYETKGAVAKSGLGAVSASGLLYIDSLLMGGKWGVQTLTYHFPQTAVGLDGVNAAQFSGLTAGEQAVVVNAMSRWAQAAALSFVPTADVAAAHLRIYKYSGDGNVTARVTAFPGAVSSIDLQIGSFLAGVHWNAGGYGYFTLLHELGHALGLKHPHDTVAGFPALNPAEDSVLTSVMSYASYPGAGVGGYTIADGSYPSGPMLNDIAAVQYLYGPNTNVFTANMGDTYYTFDPTFATILTSRWDGGGTDTWNFGNYSAGLSVDLRPGRWTSLGGQFALLDSTQPVYASVNLATPYLLAGSTAGLIENANGGSGNDTLVGNQADNRLAGGGGNDVLDGGDGDDILIGGPGDDILTGGQGADRFVFEASGGGNDTVTDFGVGDRLEVTGLPLSAFLGEGNGAGLLQGQAQIERAGGSTRVLIGTNGTPGADLVVLLQGQFTSQDFTLASGALAHRAATGQISVPVGGGTVAVAVGAPSAGPQHPALWILQSASAATVASMPVSPPQGMSYPYGVFQFTLVNGIPGSAATVAFTLPAPLPPGAQYLKYDPAAQQWRPFGGASVSGNVLTLTLVDGGSGDDDGAANGVIVDPGVIALAAPVAGAAAIPVLSPAALASLVLLMLVAHGVRRRQGT